LKRSHWIEDWLLPLAAGLLTVAWLSLWVRWLVFEASAPRLSPPLMLALMIASGLSARWVVRVTSPSAPDDDEAPYSRDPGEQARQRIVLAAFMGTLGALWLTYGARFPIGFWRGVWDWGNFIPPELINLFVCGYLWWRGVVVGQGRLQYHDLQETFYGGITALAVLFVTNQIRPRLMPGEVPTVVLGFFAVGLSALTLASFERARRFHHAPGLALNRHWLGVVVGVIGSVLLGGLAALALLAPETLARLRPALVVVDWLAYPLLVAFAFIITVIATPIFLLAEWLVARGVNFLRLFDFFRNLLPTPQPGSVDPQSASGELLRVILNSPVTKISARLVVLSLIFIFLVGLIAESLYRFRRLRDKDVDETRDSILSRELLLKQLKQLLARPRPPLPVTLAPYLALPGETDDPRRLIRQAYQSLLAWAASLGWPRGAGQTPTQYAEHLTRANPAARDSLATLTRAYLRARYSAEAPTLDEAHEAERAAAKLVNE